MAETIGDVVIEDEKAEETQQAADSFATIGAVYEDGISLIFDGTEDASEKHYKCNTSVLFAAGDRVKLAKDSGTYIVEYAVGAPKQANPEIPAGGASGFALVKASGSDYDTKWARPANVISIQNQYHTNQSYAIQLRTTSLSNTAGFQIRFGYGTWKNLTTG